MPKAQRTPEEIDAVKNRMLDEAIQLFKKRGYAGFSMRKLASKLGIAAKTIYNYYQSKDEIYIEILIVGFQKLFHRCNTSFAATPDPFDRLKNMARVYLDFGLEESNFYNLMFTWHTPKYNDYLGTPLEPSARRELEAALLVSGLYADAIKRCAPENAPINDDDAEFYLVYLWSFLHGFIAGMNNTMLDYMHSNPISMKDRFLEDVMCDFQRKMEERGQLESLRPPTLSD